MSNSVSEHLDHNLPAAIRASERRAATMADVARIAGVTKMTVSYAFSGKRQIGEETRNAILRAAKELNFSPNAHARRLASGASSHDVSLYSVNLSVGVDLLKVAFIRSVLQSRGYSVAFHSDNSPRGQAATLALLRSQRPAAIVCDGTDLVPEAVVELQRYQEEGGVGVVYDSEVDLDCDCVTYDHASSLHTAAAHLVNLGHRRIGLHILGPARPVEPSFVVRSSAGFEAAVAPLVVPAAWRFRGLSYENHEAGGADTAERLLEMPRSEWPTGMCFVNDSAAVACISSLIRAGVKIPGELSVVGVDDLPIAAHSIVPLTTVTHPVAVLSQNVVDLLASRLGDESVPSRRISVQGELVVRESTIQAPAS